MSIINEYSKKELEQIVQQSNSIKEVIDKLEYSTHSGNNYKTVKNTLQKLNIDFSHFKCTNFFIKRSDEEVFCKDSIVSQRCLKTRYIKGNYSPYKCSICGLLPVWENKPLTLILDHKDGDNHNNLLENLRWVCPNCNQQLETTGFHGKKRIYNNNQLNTEEPRHIFYKKHYYCPKCGKEKSKCSKICRECFLRKRNENVPDKEILEKLIIKYPFTKIAKLYNVSDNAVRKWCKKYNLPYKYKEIKELKN